MIIEYGCENDLKTSTSTMTRDIAGAGDGIKVTISTSALMQHTFYKPDNVRNYFEKVGNLLIIQHV